MKILVADDSRVMRQIIIRTLRQAGYDGHEILEAQDGAEALVRASAERPDLVLCDWHMPEMTGIQCLERLRSAGSTVPFGFITSDASLEMRQKAAAAGALFLLRKPFNEEMLRRTLDVVLTPAECGSDGQSGDEEEAQRAKGPGTGIPTAKDVRDVLAALLGRPVTVGPGRRIVPGQDRPAALATYVDPHRNVSAVCLADLPLAAYLGGALALLSPGGVQDAVDEDGELTPVLAESLHEVVNVLSGPLSAAGGYVRLHQLYLPGQYLSEELLLLATGFERLDLTVEVMGYGSGALSVVRTG